jgi:phosphohistidine phosphatase
MDLYILRHGKAGQSFNRPEDSDRKLTSEGRGDIRKVARWIRSKKIRFEVIATSPLTRAYETAEIVARTLKEKDRLEIWDELSPDGDRDTVFYHAAQYDKDAAVILIGHEPALSGFIGNTITGGDSASIILAKGGMAKIRNYSFDRKPSGDLQWLLTPRQMADMY